METLDFSVALKLARRLTTISEFPRNEEAIEATADDLARWCKGATVGRQAWSAESQAEWLVTEARQNWSAWHGTAALLQLFKGKFCVRIYVPPPEIEDEPETDIVLPAGKLIPVKPKGTM